MLLKLLNSSDKPLTLHTVHKLGEPIEYQIVCGIIPKTCLCEGGQEVVKETDRVAMRSLQ